MSTFRVGQSVRIKETGEVVTIEDWCLKDFCFVGDDVLHHKLDEVEPLKLGRPKKNHLMDAVRYGLENHIPDTKKKVVGNNFFAYPKKLQEDLLKKAAKGANKMQQEEAKQPKPRIQVTTLGTDYEIKTGKYKLFVYKGRYGLKIYNHNHQHDFVFQGSQPEVVKAIGELLIKCAGL
jgi:hypothetical protein